ncbi:MAG: hypothetical protein LBR39_02020 [Coriobacteriales bacterium]|nr:hypothetical protein [Coriobacteriales bacterium]
MLQVPTKILLLVAAFVWLAAGASVIYAGVTSGTAPWSAGMAAGAAVTFVVFLAVFMNIARRHVQRINSYTDELSGLFNFFDAKSYVILALMVFLGASIRLSQMVPGNLIASFYSGLGLALIVAAVYYVTSYLAVCKELGA